MKKFIPLVTIVSIAFSITPIQARTVGPTPVTCMFFRGDKLEIKQTCTYESMSWTGGGGSGLVWEDGVKTQIEWGMIGRGEKVCETNDEMRVDGICGITYYRDSVNMKRISSQERERRIMSNQKTIHCVQLRAKSICWAW